MDDRFLLHLYAFAIQSTAVTLRWSQFPASLQSDVDSISIFWSYNDEETNLLKVCISSDIHEYNLDDLLSNTMYRVWLGVNLHTGSTVFSSRLFFVTSYKGNQKYGHALGYKQFFLYIRIFTIWLFFTYFFVGYRYRANRWKGLRFQRTSLTNFHWHFLVWCIE